MPKLVLIVIDGLTPALPERGGFRARCNRVFVVLA